VRPVRFQPQSSRSIVDRNSRLRQRNKLQLRWLKLKRARALTAAGADASSRRRPGEVWRDYAVTTSAKSFSSTSSSIGENVVSGLVDSVIGLRLP
jgi:hypothetical protein